MPNLKIIGFSIVLFFALNGAFLLQGQQKLSYTHAKVITPLGKQIDVELADTEEKRQLGLAYRKELPPGKGMLFVFNERKKHAFWMKNTFISLDILWMNNHRIVHIEHSAPPPLPNQSPQTMVPSKKANFVLEIAAGQAKVLNLKLGQILHYQF
ncbi:MAG: DUF192 domain-containing protein [SAR324 cluster bacterium]|nr:DUF192 domain-containing protein [SAR324 cluster bacterium]